MAVTRLVVLDKDGTLVRNVPYSADPERIELLPGAERGLMRLASAGYRIAIASNQPGVARGHFSESALERVEGRLREIFAEIGVELAGFYYCPHHPRGTIERYRVRCGCRKPAAGLVERALAKHGAAPSESWMVGDILDDVEAGRRAGCRTVLVEGSETEWVWSPLRVPDYIAPDLTGAAAVIVAHDRSRDSLGRDMMWAVP